MSIIDDAKKLIAKKSKKIMLSFLPEAMPFLLDNVDGVFDFLKEQQKQIILQEGEVDSVLIIFFYNNILYGSISAMNADDKVTRQIICAPVKDLIVYFVNKTKNADNKPVDLKLLQTLDNDSFSDIKQSTQNSEII